MGLNDFEKFFLKGYGPTSTSGGNWYLGSTGQIGLTPNNNALESFWSKLKGKPKLQIQPIIKLQVKLDNFVNEEIPKLLEHDAEHHVGCQHGLHYSSADGSLNYPLSVLAITALMDFETDVHENQGDGSIFYVNGPMCVGLPKSAERLTRFKMAISNPGPSFSSLSPTQYFYLCNSYCVVTRTNVPEKENVYRNNPIRLSYSCECWMAQMYGICPALLLIADHEGKANPRLESCFSHVNIQKIKFDKSTKKNVKSNIQRKRTKVQTTKYDNYFGFEETPVNARYHFLTQLKKPTLSVCLKQTRRRVHLSSLQEAEENQGLAHMIASLLLGTALGDDLKDSVAAGVNPIWVAQHVKVLTENNNKKHFPEQPIVDEDALHLGFDREGEEPNVSAGDLVVDETNETSGSSSSGETTVSEPRTPTPPEPEGEVVNNDPTGMEMYRSQSSVETLALFEQIGNSPGTNIRIQQDRRKRRAAQEAESKRSKKQKLHDDDSVIHLAKIEEENSDDEVEVQIVTKTDREKVKAAVLPKKTVALKTKKPPVKKVKQTSSSAANLPTMVKRTSGRSTRSKNLNLREVVDPAAEQDDDSPYEASSDKSDSTGQVGTITKTKRQYGKKTKTLEVMSPIEESSILVPKKLKHLLLPVEPIFKTSLIQMIQKIPQG